MPKCKKCGAEISPPEDPMFDEGRAAVIVDGTYRQLTATLWDLLMVLHARRGRIVPREFLISNLWGNRINRPEPKRLNVHISRLRQKLDGSPYHIVTQSKAGYCLERTKNVRRSDWRSQ